MRADGAAHLLDGTLDPPGSGNPEAITMNDQIRELLQSGERRRDFEYLETDAIRDLLRPSPPASRGPLLAGSLKFLIPDVSDLPAAQVAMLTHTTRAWLGLATVVTSDPGRPLIVPQAHG